MSEIQPFDDTSFASGVPAETDVVDSPEGDDELLVNVDSVDTADADELATPADVVRDMFTPPAAALEIARARSELRFSPALMERTTRPFYTESPDYRAFAAEQNELIARHGRAVESVLAAMGIPESARQNHDNATDGTQHQDDTVNDAKQYTSWHYDESQQLPDGTVLPMVHEVTVTIPPPAKPFQDRTFGPDITVSSRPVMYPTGVYNMNGTQQFTGMMQDAMYFEADTHVSFVEGSSLELVGLATIASEAADEQLTLAERAAVAPWAAGYMASAPPTMVIGSGTDAFGLRGRKAAQFVDMFNGDFSDPQEAAAAISDGMKSTTYDGLATILRQSMADAARDIEVCGARERYAWIISNAAAIRQTIQAARDLALTYASGDMTRDFKEGIAQRMAAQVGRIERLEALAKHLSGLQNISDSAPGRVHDVAATTDQPDDKPGKRGGQKLGRLGRWQPGH